MNDVNVWDKMKRPQLWDNVFASPQGGAAADDTVEGLSDAELAELFSDGELCRPAPPFTYDSSNMITLPCCTPPGGEPASI